MTLSRTVSRVEIKRDSAGADETIFRREGRLARKGPRKGTNSGWDFNGGGRAAAISTYFHGSDFSGPAGVTVSAVFTSRGNYIKSFCKGREN